MTGGRFNLSVVPDLRGMTRSTMPTFTALLGKTLTRKRQAGEGCARDEQECAHPTAAAS